MTYKARGMTTTKKPQTEELKVQEKATLGDLQKAFEAGAVFGRSKQIGIADAAQQYATEHSSKLAETATPTRRPTGTQKTRQPLPSPSASRACAL